MPVNFADGSARAAMIAAADAAISSRAENERGNPVRIRARVSWLRENLLSAEGLPARRVRAGTRPAYLRCNPPPCLELWAVEDDSIPSSWVVE